MVAIPKAELSSMFEVSCSPFVRTETRESLMNPAAIPMFAKKKRKKCHKTLTVTKAMLTRTDNQVLDQLFSFSVKPTIEQGFQLVKCAFEYLCWRKIFGFLCFRPQGQNVLIYIKRHWKVLNGSEWTTGWCWLMQRGHTRQLSYKVAEFLSNVKTYCRLLWDPFSMVSFAHFRINQLIITAISKRRINVAIIIRYVYACFVSVILLYVNLFRCTKWEYPKVSCASSIDPLL